MPSAVSVPVPTLFTLSFGGVDFCLDPTTTNAASSTNDNSSQHHQSQVSFQQNNDHGVLVKLQSFSGTLRVSLASPPPSSSSPGIINAFTTATTTVEQVPASPGCVNTDTVGASNKNDTHGRGRSRLSSSAGGGVSSSPTQQQLPFVKKTMKSTHTAKSNKQVTTVITKTPDLATASTAGDDIAESNVPAKPKKTSANNSNANINRNSNNKRSVLDILTNPVSSPLQKKARGSKDDDEKNEPLPSSLMLRQPSQTQQQQQDDAEQEEADTVVIDCSQTQTSDHSSSVMMMADTSSSSNNSNNVESSILLQLDESSKLSFLDNDNNIKNNSLDQPPPPTARWGMTCTRVAGNRILVYGGQTFDSETNMPTVLDDIHVYDSSKKLWMKQPINCKGIARQWHTATYVPDRQLLISFGGETTVHPKNKNKSTKQQRIVTTDQVMVLDTEIMLWYPPTVSGDVPCGRSGHTATILPNSNDLVIFGGVRGSKFQNSLAVLDINRWSWSVPKIMSGEPPRPRSYHSATAVPGGGGSSKNNNGSTMTTSSSSSRLVIFGGNNASTSFNSVHVLERTDKGEWHWRNPTVSGVAPLPRTGHCATLLSDKKTILIYGGWDPNTSDDDDDDEAEDPIYGDSFLLDTESWTWSAGPKPTFSKGHAHQDEGNSSGLVVQDGGAQRAGHGSVLVEGDGGTEVLAFGGRIPGLKFANDFQSFKV